MIKNIFLDRDGIINNVVIRNSKVESPRNFNEFSVKDDFRVFYDQVAHRDVNLFVVSNQPDISRGLMSQNELNLITDKLKEEFDFKEILYCLHDDKDACYCRKPNPGMITKIMEKYNLKANDTILIGDSWKDIEAGKNSNIKTVFLSQPYNTSLKTEADFVINNLSEIFHLTIWE